LPQQDPEYHQSRVVVYNIPEFVNGPVKIRPQELIKAAWSKGIIKAKLDPKLDPKVEGQSDSQTEEMPYKPGLRPN